MIAVYIMTNMRNGTLYTGMTNNLIRRVYEHRNGMIYGFTKQYQCKMLVYFEQCSSIVLALERERQIKKRSRKYKLQLIESINKEWQDLYCTLI